MLRSRSTRNGFTLLEVLLVMAIIVIMGAVTVPTLSSMWGETRVRGAADEVSGAWADARSRAIDDGVPYRFAIASGTETYRIAPDTSEFWENSDMDESDDGKAKVGKLPKDIMFQLEKGPSEDAGGWTPVAVFLPDGTCKNDAEIVVKSSDGSSPHVIRVRGMTGIVTVRTLKQSQGR